MNLGGGTHHAGRDFARGYCLFNDVGVALQRLREDGLADRALVVDCDVHQGDGTAHLLGPDPRTFTLSLHGARNYPFQRVAVRPRRRPGHGHRRRALPEPRSTRRSTSRCRARGPTSPSTSRAPTPGRATASAGWR